MAYLESKENLERKHWEGAEDLKKHGRSEKAWRTWKRIEDSKRQGGLGKAWMTWKNGKPGDSRGKVRRIWKEMEDLLKAWRTGRKS